MCAYHCYITPIHFFAVSTSLMRLINMLPSSMTWELTMQEVLQDTQAWQTYCQWPPFKQPTSPAQCMTADSSGNKATWRPPLLLHLQLHFCYLLRSASHGYCTRYLCWFSTCGVSPDNSSDFCNCAADLGLILPTLPLLHLLQTFHMSTVILKGVTLVLYIRLLQHMLLLFSLQMRKRPQAWP